MSEDHESLEQISWYRTESEQVDHESLEQISWYRTESERRIMNHWNR